MAETMHEHQQIRERLRKIMLGVSPVGISNQDFIERKEAAVLDSIGCISLRVDCSTMTAKCEGLRKPYCLLDDKPCNFRRAAK